MRFVWDLICDVVWLVGFVLCCFCLRCVVFVWAWCLVNVCVVCELLCGVVLCVFVLFVCVVFARFA